MYHPHAKAAQLSLSDESIERLRQHNRKTAKHITSNRLRESKWEKRAQAYSQETWDLVVGALQDYDEPGWPSLDELQTTWAGKD